MTDELPNTLPETPRRRSKFGIFLLIIFILLLGSAFGYGYFQLAKVNLSLANMLGQVQTQLASAQSTIVELKTSVSDLQQAGQKSQELSARQEQLLTDWQAAQKGQLEKWYVAEAQYLVRLANDHLQFTHDVSMAITLLQRADQVLQNLSSPTLTELRKSLASDIASLEATPKVDVTGLYLKLDALDKRIDQLSLPINPLQPNLNEKPAVLPPNTPWWKVGMQRTWESLKKIVIVRYNGSNTLPLVLPEEKTYLYQNLHAQFESAMWGLLHRNAEVYQASLIRAMTWIPRYFVTDSEETKSMLENLEELEKTNIQPPTANLTGTLQLFDRYFSQTATQTPNREE